MDQAIPFTLLFEEPCLKFNNLIPMYDEALDISTVAAGDEIIPFVSLKNNNLGTITSTRMEKEGTDNDCEDHGLLSPWLIYGMGTTTSTKVEREVTDEDR